MAKDFSGVKKFDRQLLTGHARGYGFRYQGRQIGAQRQHRSILVDKTVGPISQLRPQSVRKDFNVVEKGEDDFLETPALHDSRQDRLNLAAAVYLFAEITLNPLRNHGCESSYLFLHFPSVPSAYCLPPTTYCLTIPSLSALSKRTVAFKWWREKILRISSPISSACESAKAITVDPAPESATPIIPRESFNSR